MTNFPKYSHWFDCIWPQEGELYQDVLVPEGADLDLVAKAVADNPNVTYLLVVEDFDKFNKEIPEGWLRMPPEGGFPKNVFVGAQVSNQAQADKRMQRLVRIRAKKLFLLFPKGHAPGIDLKAGLIAWRCSNCGRKEGYGRMFRPKKCPSGKICEGAPLDPQIHFIVGMDQIRISNLEALCAKYGVALWNGEMMEVPS